MVNVASKLEQEFQKQDAVYGGDVNMVVGVMDKLVDVNAEKDDEQVTAFSKVENTSFASCKPVDP